MLVIGDFVILFGVWMFICSYWCIGAQNVHMFSYLIYASKSVWLALV